MIKREQEKCPCGLPLHYVDQNTRMQVEELIRLNGAEVKVKTPLGTWMIPRHYIALHGIKTMELPGLAARYGFREVK